MGGDGTGLLASLTWVLSKRGRGDWTEQNDVELPVTLTDELSDVQIGDCKEENLGSLRYRSVVYRGRHCWLDYWTRLY